MPDADPTEERRLELEELRLRNERELREKELELEHVRLAQAQKTTRMGGSSSLRVALVSVISAVVGASASLGAAFLSGLFTV
jgi:hypothetical protein